MLITSREPQKSDSTNLMSLGCSEQAQCCMYLFVFTFDESNVINLSH